MFRRIKEKLMARKAQPKRMVFKLEGYLNEETGNYICPIPHFNVVFHEDGTCVGAYNPEGDICNEQSK